MYSNSPFLFTLLPYLVCGYSCRLVSRLISPFLPLLYRPLSSLSRLYSQLYSYHEYMTRFPITHFHWRCTTCFSFFVPLGVLVTLIGTLETRFSVWLRVNDTAWELRYYIAYLCASMSQFRFLIERIDYMIHYTWNLSRICPVHTDELKENKTKNALKTHYIIH